MSLVSRVNDLAAAVRDKFNLITAALALKAPLADPAFTGTPTGITKAHVGLGSVDNTADSAKPVSTAQQSAIDAKPNLATSGTPAAVGTAARGTASTAARSDHVHAHGNQAGGTLHADASGSASGFLSATFYTALNGRSASPVGSTIVTRDADSSTAFNGCYASAFFIGSRYFNTNGANFGCNVSIYAVSFVPTSDLTLKENVARISDTDAMARVLRIEPISFDWIETGLSDRGFGAQTLQAIDPLYVRGGTPKTTTKMVESAGPSLPGVMRPLGEIEEPVLDPTTGEQERNPLGLNTTALLADAIAAIRVLHARIAELEKSSTAS